ncbi:TIGR03936 family radical SAM-associated protein [Tepidanaerobacter acetatoxydans]|uniref:TIGR03936 family radical SAM-associated protein n=1 Tax=Tepidanaerobacter acetatoxydans TaxID=499229 RepID=UPI001BD2F348
MKLRMKFKKGRPVMFISHLDMIRTFERSFRRTDLPLAFTQGFNPRSRISFTPALSVGITSSSEYMDVEFEETVSPEDAVARLSAVLPEGIQIIKAETADNKIPLSIVNAATYMVKTALDEENPDELEKAINNLLNREEIIIEKSTKFGAKSVNIAPFIYNMKLLSNTNGTADICMEVSIGQQGSVSPKLIIFELEKLLAKKLEIVSIHREEIFYLNENNKILPL